MTHGAATCALMLLASSALAQPAGPMHRYALFVGNNEGGKETQPLLYARDDARRLHDVFLRVGGIKPEDALLLLDDTADDVTTALSELERRSSAARARGEQTTLLFYFSGHAKDGNLRLGQTKLALEAVKQRLAQAPADARVAVFDACRSGAVTRTKGVRRAPAFEVETDNTRAAKGLVILTSSASDEDSQESDLIGASYFSYHLATGLIGGADQSRDGRVSLAEAYAYAYERTVASTADSSGGAQHPTFSFDLAGNGDLNLTDVAQRKEGLRFPASAPTGVYFLVDTRGVVAAEIDKQADERLIALAPGTYTVKRRLADRLRIGDVRIAEGAVETLDETKLRDAKFSDDPVKGASLKTTYSRHWSIAASGQYQAIFDRPTSAGGYFPSAPLIEAEATLHNLLARGLALSLDGGYGWGDGVVNSGLIRDLSYRYSLFTLGISALYEVNAENVLVPFFGVRIGLNVMNRDFEGAGLPSQGFTVMSPGLVGGLKWRFARNFSALARVRVHYLLYNVDVIRNLGYAEVGGMLEYEFRD